MVTARNITKSYGSLTVLHGIDLEVQAGEMLAIVGPSGAGKTTLLQILGTLERADSGQVIYSNEDVTTLRGNRLAHFRNRNIGFVFQTHQLLPEFTLEENVAMPAMIGGMKQSEALEHARQLLERLGLGQRLTHLPSQLSGGEAQRGSVARALINRPQVVFADEPTGSLDSHNREELHRLFRQLCIESGQTFVIVTHDNSLAQMVDRTIHMADGRITDIVTN